jgi:NAD(P)-dependent dehydrogenase (short-subunit alcohol dehydrogenase family)
VGWSTRRIGDLVGRTAVVTGANSGIGRETASALAAAGAGVVLGCRDPGRAADAVAAVGAVATGPAPVAVTLDLADLASVRDAAGAVGGLVDGLDLVVANAGVMALPPMLSADGHELQFATNHLGHFALVGHLLPLMGDRPGARVVTVSSLAAWTADVVVDDLQSERGYDPWRTYGRSKRANLLFAFELDRRARRAGLALRSVAAHPGYAATALVANGPGRFTGPTGRVVYALSGLVAQSAAAGARPVLRAATDPTVDGGDYIGPRWVGRGAAVRVHAPPGARREAAGAALWAASEDLSDVRFLS